MDEPLGAFSSVFHGVLHTKNIRAYIHYDIEELEGYELSHVFTENLITDNQLKLEFAHLQRKGFTQFMDFSIIGEVEWVWYILICNHGEFIWVDQPYKITKEVIINITYLHKIGGILGPRCKLSNTEIWKLTSATFYGHSMRVDDVREIDDEFSTMIISYKFY